MPLPENKANRCLAFQGAQWTSAVIRPQIILYMLLQLFKRGIMKGLGGGLLDRPVHALDLAIGPGMEGLG